MYLHTYKHTYTQSQVNKNLDFISLSTLKLPQNLGLNTKAHSIQFLEGKNEKKKMFMTSDRAKTSKTVKSRNHTKDKLDFIKIKNFLDLKDNSENEKTAGD